MGRIGLHLGAAAWAFYFVVRVLYLGGGGG